MEQLKLFDIPLLNVRTCEVDELFKFKLNRINESLSEEEKDIFCDRVCDYYHNVVGFPYYEGEVDVRAEMERLEKYDVERLLLEEGELQQVMLGLNICNVFHPHMWNVKCRNSKTPKEVFHDKALFKIAIRKRLAMSDSKLGRFNVRKSLKIFSGAQSVSNFRPTVASYLYFKYCPDGATVLDPCMGYGGRLLGSIVSQNVRSYHGVDPCVKTFEGNCRLNTELSKNDSNKLFNVPFEDFAINGLYDFVFTSPPYFDLEKYSDESTQSYIRYPQYDEWVKGFLRPLIEKSYTCLKEGRYFAINVDGEKLIKEVKFQCVATGFDLVDTLHMRLSRMPGKGMDRDIIKFKTEPIFIWRKQ